MNIDQNLLRARTHYYLKSLLTADSKLEPSTLEHMACEVFGLKRVGEQNDFADGVNDRSQASIKTRFLKPTKTKTFQSYPDHFLGYQFNHKQQTVTNGIELVQRRQVVDESQDAKKIGAETIQKFVDKIGESRTKYGVTTSYEVILCHGYSWDRKTYLVSVFWQPYQALDAKLLDWRREKNCVAGYEKHFFEEGYRDVKMCLRYNGNIARMATNFIEYKNPTKYQYSCHVQVQTPQPWPFDYEATLAELDLKDSDHATNLPKRRRRTLSQ